MTVQDISVCASDVGHRMPTRGGHLDCSDGCMPLQNRDCQLLLDITSHLKAAAL